MALDNPVLLVVFVVVFLYGVIRAGVRDGILQADERRQKAGVGDSNGDGA